MRVVLVNDADGGQTRAPFSALIVDGPTVVRNLAVEHINDGSVRVDVTASDPDGDALLLYDYDFDGDGVDEITDAVQSSVVHQYATHGDYTVRVTITDTWSGEQVVVTKAFRLLQWIPDNTPPVVADIVIVDGPRGQVDLTVEGFDADGDPLTYAIHWGDENDADASQELPGGIGRHDYAYRPDMRPYAGWVTVTDDQGAEHRRDFDVVVTDNATIFLGCDRRRQWPNSGGGQRWRRGLSGGLTVQLRL